MKTLNNFLEIEDLYPLNEFDLNFLSSNEFGHFCTFSNLEENGYNDIPNEPGLYVVLMPNNFTPIFTDTSTAISEFRGRNLLATIETLQENWVKNSRILYIGKSNNLNRRFREFVRYGYGLGVNKRGGRYIWQLVNCHNLLIGYVTDNNPRETEHQLIVNFRNNHNGKRPFANLQD